MRRNLLAATVGGLAAVLALSAHSSGQAPSAAPAPTNPTFVVGNSYSFSIAFGDNQSTATFKVVEAPRGGWVRVEGRREPNVFNGPRWVNLDRITYVVDNGKAD